MWMLKNTRHLWFSKEKEKSERKNFSLIQTWFCVIGGGNVSDGICIRKLKLQMIKWKIIEVKKKQKERIVFWYNQWFYSDRNVWMSYILRLGIGLCQWLKWIMLIVTHGLNVDIFKPLVNARWLFDDIIMVTTRRQNDTKCSWMFGT